MRRSGPNSSTASSTYGRMSSTSVTSPESLATTFGSAASWAADTRQVANDRGLPRWSSTNVDGTDDAANTTDGSCASVTTSSLTSPRSAIVHSPAWTAG